MVDNTRHEDIDARETEEWRDALTSVLEREGEVRAHYLLEELIDLARRSGVYLPYRSTTAYLNTISAAQEDRSPGDASIEWRVRSLIRWNALAMVVNANRESPELGGHIATFASSATLYDVGISSTFRVTRHPESMRELFWKVASPKHRSNDSGRKLTVRDCPPIRIPG